MHAGSGLGLVFVDFVKQWPIDVLGLNTVCLFPSLGVGIIHGMLDIEMPQFYRRVSSAADWITCIASASLVTQATKT